MPVEIGGDVFETSSKRGYNVGKLLVHNYFVELNEFLKLCTNPSERHIFFNKHISHRYPVIFRFYQTKFLRK